MEYVFICSTGRNLNWRYELKYKMENHEKVQNHRKQSTKSKMQLKIHCKKSQMSNKPSNVYKNKIQKNNEKIGLAKY